MKLFDWNTKRAEISDDKTVDKSTQSIIINSKEKFNILIADTVIALLKDNGFGKKALTFYKNTDELIYVINFQNSQGNTSEQTKFYVNCGIYSALIDKTIGKIELKEPKEYECHYRVRISTLTNSVEDSYKIEMTTDLETIKLKVTNDLKVVLGQFENINSLSKLTDLMITYNSLDFTLFEYFIMKSDKLNLRKQVKKIQELWSSESRWKKIKENLNQKLIDYNQEKTLEEILAEE